MSTEFYKKYLKLEKKRRQLILKLFSIQEMVQGSFCLIQVRCGKSNCRCKQGQLHPHHRMFMRKNKKHVSRTVPNEDYSWITEVTANYREYRKIPKFIYKLDNQIKEVFELHREVLVRRSSKEKIYLDFENKNENASEKAIKIKFDN